MIYTVTLNPSIDYIVRLDSLVTGITNRTTSEEYYYGGKGINVSCVLAELGIESTAFGFIAGFTGGEETEINCQGPHIGTNELERLLQKIDRLSDGDTIVIAGNVPSTMPDNVYEKILDRIKDKKIRIIIDATKTLLVNSLKYKPFLIKPNRQELSELFNVDICNEYDTEKYANELRRMGAKNVLISLGQDGAMLIDETGKKYKAGVFNEKVINTVGSGDSMVAGFIAGYEKTGSYQQALKLGSVCGNATAFLSGLATKEKINELLAKFS